MSASPLSRIFAGLIGAAVVAVTASAALSQEPLPWRGQGDAYSPQQSGRAVRMLPATAMPTVRRPPATEATALATPTAVAAAATTARRAAIARRATTASAILASPTNGGGYGQPYTPPPPGTDPDAQRYGEPGPGQGRYYEQNEIVSAGHGFFGAVSKGLASAVEYAFKSQGRPNGYILGEDAGGAFVVGLRYGEGMLYTKDAGDHKVYWQGPSVGYDAGARRL